MVTRNRILVLLLSTAFPGGKVNTSLMPSNDKYVKSS